MSKYGNHRVKVQMLQPTNCIFQRLYTRRDAMALR